MKAYTGADELHEFPIWQIVQVKSGARNSTFGLVTSPTAYQLSRDTVSFLKRVLTLTKLKVCHDSPPLQGIHIIRCSIYSQIPTRWVFLSRRRSLRKAKKDFSQGQTPGRTVGHEPKTYSAMARILDISFMRGGRTPLSVFGSLAAKLCPHHRYYHKISCKAYGHGQLNPGHLRCIFDTSQELRKKDLNGFPW
ncbi:hypothetical protein BDY19DRAFT_1051357 [Irpex rosettiformis]|uniref:Uncharacterized protein n=1 Tax=Irpex rosettiformis TaxID=378272 RepID=A0ACB8TR04_9APHY|nr:hypothetical protein BDY19DRAFT_1051357 [Irpex rosettiformis]